MIYKEINPELFKNNRCDFFSLLPNNSIAIFNSNDLMPKNADQLMSFKQNSDLFYLSGIDQEETILVLINNGGKTSEFLFVRETNETIKIWEGEKLSKNRAKKISGIDAVFWNTEFKKVLPTLMGGVKKIYLIAIEIDFFNHTH